MVVSPYPTKTEMVVLEQLMSGRELYGLELVAQSGGRLKRGTVYVLLDRLEEKGLIHSRVDPADGRRRYKISGHGQRIVQAGEATALPAAAWRTA